MGENLSYRWLWLTAALAGGFTLVVTVASAFSFAYRSPGLHVAVETTAALVALTVAQLFYARFRRSLRARDLILTAALVVLAATNVLFSLVPSLAGMTASFSSWAPAAARLLGTSLLALAAFVPPRALRHPVAATRRWFAGCALALAAIAVVVGVAGQALPPVIEPGLSPESSTRPRIVGHPVLLGAQLVVMLLSAAAAVGFARAARREQDSFLQWVAVAAILGAFSRLNYFLFPSLYSEWFYTGDILRLGFYVALLVGGALEIQHSNQELLRSTSARERAHLARELHDGVAQDLAFIVQHGRRLADRGSSRQGVSALVAAAEHALVDSRQMISALTQPPDEPLGDSLTRTAEEVAAREGAEVEVHAADVAVPTPTREALLRITREAITNAIRHGRASKVSLDLCEEHGMVLRITDDGAGFDAYVARQRPGHFGLRSMEERARALGGELTVSSTPGAGTEVMVRVP